MLQAYHGDKSIKSKAVLAMKADIKAERLQKGHYWDENKGNGCFVGCVIRGSAHVKFETVLGIPRILARLGDCLFEGQPYEDAKKFTVDFLNVIKPGADLSKVWMKFMHFILVDKKSGVINFTKNEKSLQSINAVANLFNRQINGEVISREEWLKARDAAYAADAAAYAAASAAYAADAAAYAAAYAAASAAYAAASAAYAAAYAAASAAYAAVRKKHYVVMAKAFIEFLKEAK